MRDRSCAKPDCRSVVYRNTCESLFLAVPLKRLTDRQVAVLAAVERLGNPTLPIFATSSRISLRAQSWRVLDGLETKGYVVPPEIECGCISA